MPLPPTPWLNPPDYTGAFVHGAQIGASAQEAQNRLAATFAEANARLQAASQSRAAELAHQEQMAQMQSQIRLQIADQRAKEQQQRIAIDSAYKESQIGLERERLKETHAANQFRLQQQASRTATMMQAQQEIEAGGDPNEVWSRLGPAATGSLAGVGPMARAAHPAPIPESAWVPANPETGEPSHWANQKTGGITQERRPATDPYTASQSRILERQIEKLNLDRDTPGVKPKIKDELDKQIQKAQDSLARLHGRPVAPRGMPLPKTEKELQKDQVYQTNRGLAKWDGAQFIPEETQ